MNSFRLFPQTSYSRAQACASLSVTFGKCGERKPISSLLIVESDARSLLRGSGRSPYFDSNLRKEADLNGVGEYSPYGVLDSFSSRPRHGARPAAPQIPHRYPIPGTFQPATRGRLPGDCQGRNSPWCPFPPCLYLFDLFWLVGEL